MAPGNSYLVPGTWYLVLVRGQGTKHDVPITCGSTVPETWYLVPGAIRPKGHGLTSAKQCHSTLMALGHSTAKHRLHIYVSGGRAQASVSGLSASKTYARRFYEYSWNLESSIPTPMNKSEHSDILINSPTSNMDSEPGSNEFPNSTQQIIRNLQRSSNYADHK